MRVRAAVGNAGVRQNHPLASGTSWRRLGKGLGAGHGRERMGSTRLASAARIPAGGGSWTF